MGEPASTHDDLPAAVLALMENPTFQSDADAGFRALVTLAEAWLATSRAARV